MLVTCFCLWTIAAQEPSAGNSSKLVFTDVAPAPTDASGLAFASMDFHGALIHGNSEQLNIFLAEKFQGRMLDGSVLNRTSVLEQVAINKQMFMATVSPPVVRGDEASVTGRVELYGKDGDKGDPEAVFRFTDSWRRFGEKWLITKTTMTYVKRPSAKN